MLGGFCCRCRRFVSARRLDPAPVAGGNNAVSTVFLISLMMPRSLTGVCVWRMAVTGCCRCLLRETEWRRHRIDPESFADNRLGFGRWSRARFFVVI